MLYTKKLILNINTRKVKGYRKMYHAKTNQKKGGIGISISDYADFRPRKPEIKSSFT